MDMIDTSGHISVEDRKALGQRASENTPMATHGGWQPAADRSDPVDLLVAQNANREPDLVPVRHGRMMVSPFTFYRGAAKIMASDLAGSPTAGLDVQLCGDAHLSNFGVFASPERTLLFDLNDFDETLPGPFEYDVKRMAASFVIGGRNNGFSAADARSAAGASVAAYRKAMAEFAEMGTMDVWYARLPADQILSAVGANAKTKQERKLVSQAGKALAKAKTRDSLQALSKLSEEVDGQRRIISDPPVLIPERELGQAYGLSPE